jgi:hypothetical protein
MTTSLPSASSGAGFPDTVTVWEKRSGGQSVSITSGSIGSLLKIMI